MLNRHSIQRHLSFYFRITIFAFYLLVQWSCIIQAKDTPDSHDNRYSYHEFQGNMFTWRNGIDTDYVMDPIADTLVYVLLSYPVRIVMVNEDSVNTKKLSNYERDGYLVKDYFNEVFRMEIPTMMDSIEALCFRHIVINNQGRIIFYEAKWYRELMYYDIENEYLSKKIASILEQSGPWLDSEKSDKHKFSYIPSGFTIYVKPGITVTDEQQR